MAKKYGKQSERWLMGYNKRPKDFKQIDDVVDMYESLGVDRLATWTYRGGYGTSVAAKDALELWDNIGIKGEFKNEKTRAFEQITY